jgi:aryl-alcohol dehydrogenase-like predicted oxidoreductase
MRYLDVAGLRVSRIGLGTWQFGSREWGYGEAYARDVAPVLVRRAIDLGITMIDSAEAYGPARSERIIGAALADLPADRRDRVIVATKFLPIAPLESVVAWQASGSRRRLRTDALDLYYVHWANPFVSPRRVMQSLRPLTAEGGVRRVGVSNFSLSQWQEAERALGAPVVANQVRFSLLSPGPAADLVPYAAGRDRLVVAYSPLGQGLLGGSGTPAGGMRGMQARVRRNGQGRLAALQAALRDLAAAYGATPAQVALAWLLAHPNTLAIPGARTLAQLEENAAAADLSLSEADILSLTAEAETLIGS